MFDELVYIRYLSWVIVPDGDEARSKWWNPQQLMQYSDEMGIQLELKLINS
jgi:hypothetical protein